jgi:hypothetical protein
MKYWWHKLWHWEYWPVYIVYLFTFFLWVWYAIRFRSFKFYKHANPSIKNGGLYGDSKMAIYQLLPKNLYPKTILVGKHQSIGGQTISQNQFQFPLIVKPDIGSRGVGVQKVHSIEELMNYGTTINGDYLIQELIDLPNEIGLFYCRLPNEAKGKITGITIKEFLMVVGDGATTIEKLMKKKARFGMQIPRLENKMNLHEILPKGEKKCLVPFGNHNRGTTFFDGKKLITHRLEETFDAILNKIQGFYYGRLDVRFNTLEELEQGINFSIIEINGAKSEHTHIYDPKYSFGYGQFEIFRHQRILAKIIRINTRRLKRFELCS